MTVTAFATLSSTGNITAFKSGDVLTYTVTVSGDQGQITPGTVTVAGVAVPVSGGPWSFTLPETFTPPTTAGITLNWQQQTDPHVFKATVP